MQKHLNEVRNLKLLQTLKIAARYTTGIKRFTCYLDMMNNLRKVILRNTVNNLEPD
jgi:hypothetical protein